VELGGRWTNDSVREFAKGADPVDAIVRAARDVVVRAIDQGWSGPPFDPFMLADILRLDIVARDDVPDARTVTVGNSKVRVEFNPNRPRGRVRYSVAHEIAHTLFSDCVKSTRYRAAHSDPSSDEWQLEALCNIAAAEFLMPVGSFPASNRSALSAEYLLELRARYDVSTEALFIRVAQVSAEPCAMFSASRSDRQKETRYRLDYAIGSRAWRQPLVSGSLLPTSSVVADCTAIGYTAKGQESWAGSEAMRIECVGIPPYPRSSVPRVVGMLVLRKTLASDVAGITEVRGNALAPRGAGRKLIVHIVNDATANWGGSGFAHAVRAKWPAVQKDFKDWTQDNRAVLSLGKVRIATVDEETAVASMICQKGYGASTKPRIRYTALRDSLKTVAAYAKDQGLTVHMPRIGTGQAGGSWEIIRELILSSLCTTGTSVTVYHLPNAKGSEPPQQSLSLAVT
jgi:O-acetyl-ADP-ribose deacetylase (regulator of RNase III)